MDKDQIIQALFSKEYIIKVIVECWCDFDWQLVEGELTVSEVHEDQYLLNRLLVEGVNVAEYDFTRKDISTYEGLENKDIPDEVKDNLVKDRSRNSKITWHEEHDPFRKAGSLVEFLREGGYAVDVYKKYFLLVDYGEKRTSWVDNQEWVDQFLGPNGPLENPDACFVFVDNTRFENEIVPV